MGYESLGSYIYIYIYVYTYILCIYIYTHTIYMYIHVIYVYVWTSLVAQWYRIHLPMQETHVHSLDGDKPWRTTWQSTAVLLPKKSYGQRSLVDYSPWGHRELLKTEATLTCTQACWALWLSKPAFSSINQLMGFPYFLLTVP